MVILLINTIMVATLTTLLLLFYLGVADVSMVTLEISTIRASFVLDPMGIVLSVVVIIITGTILAYTNYYIRDDAHNTRFILTLTLFSGSMVVLVIRGSAPVLLLGWDGLGLRSYFLVAYYPRISDRYPCTSPLPSCYS
jgi:NADH-quinone oxidoreductase subunit L